MTPSQPRHAIGSEAGSVLLIVLTLTFLCSALTLAATTVVTLNSTLSARFGDATEGLYVAESGLAVALAELRAVADWSPVLTGAVRSGASRGPFSSAAVAGGTVLLCCGDPSVAGRLSRESALAPVPGRRGLVWQPYLWSPWDRLVPQPQPGAFVVIVFVQDDGEDGDGDGRTDLNGVVVVRSEAVRPDGLRRVVESLVERVPGDPARGVADRLRILRWQEVR